MENTINEQLKELFNNTSFEHYEYDNIDNAEDLIEKIIEEISGEEVIYYSNAMKYLLQNDPGLQISIGLAIDTGYKIDDINSELLAKILKQNKLDDELLSLEDDIKKIYLESFTHNLSSILDRL